ncbi:unnamed protein product [Citrullus colocynthis]|uniref:Uncharacterized protein n=1 Tax=Citrullus colocynthis TaxID=252529 RepID=A0ABP0XU04_9ROSI
MSEDHQLWMVLGRLFLCGLLAPYSRTWLEHSSQDTGTPLGTFALGSSSFSCAWLKSLQHRFQLKPTAYFLFLALFLFAKLTTLHLSESWLFRLSLVKSSIYLFGDGLGTCVLTTFRALYRASNSSSRVTYLWGGSSWPQCPLS